MQRDPYSRKYRSHPSHPLNQFFDAIYFINLIDRPNRRKNIEQQLERFGISARCYQAIRPTSVGKYSTLGLRGCAESHFNIIKLSKSSKYNNVLIFEDDIVIHSNFNKIIHDVLKELEQLPWDMFYFGYELHAHNSQLANPNGIIYKLCWTFLAHAYAINARLFDEILSHQNKIDEHSSIDGIYVHGIQNHHNIYGINLIDQNHTFKSDIQNAP